MHIFYFTFSRIKYDKKYLKVFAPTWDKAAEFVRAAYGRYKYQYIQEDFEAIMHFHNLQRLDVVAVK